MEVTLSMHEPYFSAENLYKVWDTVTVDFSFTAERGTMTTIVGPSGSGKSTVLRLIAGLDTGDSRVDNDNAHADNDDNHAGNGALASSSNTLASNSDTLTDSSEAQPGKHNSFAPHITLDGKDITHLEPGKRETGMVAQSGALFLHLTVEDNVAYGLECRGMSKKESRRQAESFLAKFNLEGFAKRYPETLSGGEAQRVALARTLIVQPKLVLFDEPLSALDAPLRKKLAEDIRMMQKETAFTGIMVTHDINEAKTISDTIILMEKGRKKWEGKPAEFSERLF